MSDPRLASQIHTLAKLVESAESNYYKKNFKKAVDGLRTSYGTLVSATKDATDAPNLNKVMRVLFEKTSEIETILQKYSENK